MNLEELNKNQIVLLTLLVSFVTSIATGIVTVTLMDQAPAGITQTINRIVERTVERVVPGPIQTATVIKEVSVIVTEEDLIVNAIKSTEPAVVKIISATEPDKMLGSGFIISEDGLVATILDVSASSTEPIKYKAVLANGDLLDLILKQEFNQAEIGSVITVMSLTVKPEHATDKLAFLNLADAKLSVGQTVLAIGAPLSLSEPNISISKIGAIITASASSTPQIKTVAASKDNFGGPVINTKGLVIGISRGASFAVDASVLKTLQ